MSYAIDAVFTRATTLLERERRRLNALNQARGHIVADVFDTDGIASMSRALTYVVCGGILEQLMRELPEALSADLLAMRLVRNQLPYGLLSILEATEFRKCGNQSAHALHARANLVKSIVGHGTDIRAVVDFSTDLVIADGTSIGIKHFIMLWAVLGLPGVWYNESMDMLLLRELTDKRNNIAHWEEDPVDVGRSKSYSDLMSAITALIKLIDHVYLHVADWLDGFKTSAP